MYARDTASIATPIGLVLVTGHGDMLDSIAILGSGQPVAANTHALREAVDQLAAFFEGRLTAFDLPLTACRTPRGRALRAGIVAIGYGDTASYGSIARAIGSGARAIGQACARNPFPIVVPCHRVLAASGELGRYSAGDGPTTKQWLLALEQGHREPPIPCR